MSEIPPPFDEMERSDASPKKAVESDYDFLNRSARPEEQRVRDLVQQWCREYPADEQGEIVSRLRDGDFRSVTFELYVSALLRASMSATMSARGRY
jgi:hypothetical protein